MSDQTPTGDMGAAIEAAFSAATPAADPSPSPTTPASVSATPETPSPTPEVTATEVEGQAVPYPRFKEVNEQAKTLKAQIERYKWAEKIKPEHASELAAFYERINQNPLALLDEVEELARNPQTAPMVKSWAARTLGTRIAAAAQAQATPAPADPEPQPDTWEVLEHQDGTKERRPAYSTAQLQAWQTWRERQLESKWQQQIAPLQQSAQQLQRERTLLTLKSHATEAGRAELDAMRQKPHFKEHEAAIKAAMLADARLSLKDAYLQVITEQVIPKLTQSTVASLQQKVGASSANPSRPSGAVSGPPKTFRDGLVAMLGGA